MTRTTDRIPKRQCSTYSCSILSVKKMTLGREMYIVLPILILAAQYPGFDSVSNSQPRGCLCPGETLHFECTIEGGGTTVWEGTLLTCRPSIQIRHQDFTDEERNITDFMCYDQAINATVWYRANADNRYYSRLSISRVPGLLPVITGETVICTYDDGAGVRNISTWTVIDPLSPPTNLRLEQANTTHLKFSWDTLALSCSSLQYDILTTNCGMCPSISRLPFFVCENADITIDTRVCSVAVQARCGDVAGNVSNIFQVPLKIPEAPHVTTIPTYSNHTNNMLWLNVTLNDVVLLEGSDISYTIQLSDATSDISCVSQPLRISSSSCQHGYCSHQFDISKSLCALSDIAVSAFATNRFGNGPKSKSRIDAQNSLVNIDFDYTRQAFVCNFLDATSNGIKSCIVNVTHGNNCENHVGIYSGKGFGDYVTLEALNLTGKVTDYCFNIIAQSGATTVAVFVTEVPQSPSSEHQRTTIIIALIVVIVSVIMAVTGVSIGIKYCLPWCKSRKPDHTPLHTIEFSVTREDGALEKALAVFENLRINMQYIKTRTSELDRNRTLRVTYNHSRVHVSELISKLKDDKHGGVIEAKEVLHDEETLQTVVVHFYLRDKVGTLLKVLKLLKKFDISIDNLDGGDYRDTDKTRKLTVKWECSEGAKNALLDALKKEKDVIDPQEEFVPRRRKEASTSTDAGDLPDETHRLVDYESQDDEDERITTKRRRRLDTEESQTDPDEHKS